MQVLILILLGWIWSSAALSSVTDLWLPEVKELLSNVTESGQLISSVDLDGMGETRLNELAPLANDREGNLRCREVKSGGRRQTCCRVNDVEDDFKFSIRCLPTFIIGGSQKSGTTALAAFLAAHPDVSFSTRKELHYFSNEKHWKKGIAAGYLGAFKHWNYSDPQWTSSPPMYGEATPFYIASRLACPRIRDALGADVRMVVLLREPAARTYSEYQMKARRVEQQNEFLDLCQQHTKQMYECLRKPSLSGSSLKWSVMKKCLPTDIVKHSHWGKFVQSIDALIDKADVWTDVLDQCFKEKENHNDNDNDKEKDGVSVKDETRKGKKRGKGKGKKKLLLPKPKRKTKRNKKLSSNMEFTPLTCMKKHAKEKLKSIEEAFFNEIRDFQHCSQNITNVHSSLAGLDRAIDQCVKVKSGIGSQYIYRSLYVAQLYHCFKSLPREQIMVIPAERLRQQPAQTLEKVLRFVGLSVPSNMSTSDVSDDGIRSAVNKHFPIFEKSTGWRLTGEYEPMDDSVKTRLREFFEPYNRRLFKYLGDEYIEEWGM